jgi:hypothetical protein
MHVALIAAPLFVCHTENEKTTIVLSGHSLHNARDQSWLMLSFLGSMSNF